MSRPALVASIIVGALVAGIIVAALVGSIEWKRDSRRAIDRMAPSAEAPTSTRRMRFMRDELVGLPAPVVRYFEFALTPNQPMVESAHIRWTGDFSMRSGQWRPFSATQDYASHGPGFVWDARIAMLPLVPVRVRDSYVGGEGSLLAAVGGVVRVAHQRGTREMAEGELMRYLGEAVWFPTALLPSQGVRWRAIDDSTATAMLTDGATTVSIDVHFGASGEILRLTAMRPRDVNGTFVPTPWVARLSDYERHAGMMVPMAGSVEWNPLSGPVPYWRARPIHIRYELAR